MRSFKLDDPVVRIRMNVVQRLAINLAQINMLGEPPADLLNRAPIIDEWSIGPLAVQALRGRIHNLPGAPAPITSQELFILDKDRGYARTLTQLLRLGSPLGSEGGRENE